MQWMTYKGGWINFHNQWTDRDEPKTFSTPPDPPTFSESTGWSPGRYRCIKRANGRIDEVLWTTESPDGDEFYERLRREHRQREELEEMSVEEIDATIKEGTFDALRISEVYDVRSEKRETEMQDDEAAETDDDSDLEAIERKLLMHNFEEYDGDPGEAARDTFDKLLELKQSKIDRCEFCDRRYGLSNCPSCGKRACRTTAISSPISALSVSTHSESPIPSTGVDQG